MTPRTATLIGLTAILMWSLLSVLTVATGKIPAFQLAAMTFAIGAAVAFASFIFRPSAFNALKQPLIAWVVGVGGLFGYHALYFLALRFAPPAEAGLLNYLWPLLIVLFSSLLPGERLLSELFRMRKQSLLSKSRFSDRPRRRNRLASAQGSTMPRGHQLRTDDICCKEKEFIGISAVPLPALFPPSA